MIQRAWQSIFLFFVAWSCLPTWAQAVPQPVHLVSPGYPELARQAQIQGSVNLRAHINTAGAVASIQITKGHPLLLEEVEKNLDKWRFSPGKEITIEMTYEFRLDSPKVTYVPSPVVIFDLPNKVLVVSHAPVPIMDGAILKKKK